VLDLWYLLRMTRVAVIGCLVAGLAASAAADGAMRIDVAVGETIERDVGFAMGLQCDDVAIVRVELRAGTPESNTFAVTGVTEGTTMCRVGTAPNRPTYVIEIHVVAPRRRR
jgi:hypothetical protein